MEDSITVSSSAQVSLDGGLVSSFISGRSSDDSLGASFGVEIVPGGVIVKRLGCGGGNPEPEKRGKVKGFSRASRRRCMEMLMRLDWPSLSAQSKHSDPAGAFFVTLTYPDKVRYRGRFALNRSRPFSTVTSSNTDAFSLLFVLIICRLQGAALLRKAKKPP